MDFLGSLKDSLSEFNDLEAISKFNSVINALITQKIEKIKNKFVDFLGSLKDSLSEFNDLEAISK